MVEFGMGSGKDRVFLHRDGQNIIYMAQARLNRRLPLTRGNIAANPKKVSA